MSENHESSVLEREFGLRGRTALVTGGSSGIGRAIAVGLAGAGAQVIVVARTVATIQDTVAEIEAAGAVAIGLPADLATREGVAALIAEIGARELAVDILVTSAGTNPRPPMSDLTEQVWDEVMAVNLDAPFLLGQAYGPAMAARGWGRIINIGSQQAVRAFGNSGAYGVSKAGITALTRSQAEAWSASGVSCNTLMPGFVVTPLTEATVAIPGRADALAARTMVGRNGVPDDFVGAALFLAGESARFVTGSLVYVDGGFAAT